MLSALLQRGQHRGLANCHLLLPTLQCRGYKCRFSRDSTAFDVINRIRRGWDLLPIKNALFWEKVFMAAIVAVSQSTRVAGKAWYLLDHFCLWSSGSVMQRCTH